MNIVFFCSRSPYHHPGGAEIHTRLVAEGLASRGHSVVIYTGGPAASELPGDLRVVTTPFLYPYPFRTVLSPVKSLLLQQRLLKDRYLKKADIVHAVDMDSIILVSRWQAIVNKLVVTIQDYGLLDKEIDESINPKDSVRRYFYNRTLKRLTHAVCVSNYVKKCLHKQAPWVKTAVIGNFVPDDWFHHPPLRKDIDILYVGRMEAYKGIHILDRAIGIIRQSIPDFTVFCIGTGQYRMKEKRGVTVIPFVPFSGIQPFYLRAKILVAPSVWPEPCGRTIIEAMASGIPVVATRVGGTPETMTHNHHGMLVSPDSPEEIASACLALLQSVRLLKKMGLNARNHAANLFSREKTIERYESFYRLRLKKPSL